MEEKKRIGSCITKFARNIRMKQSWLKKFLNGGNNNGFKNENLRHQVKYFRKLFKKTCEDTGNIIQFYSPKHLSFSNEISKIWIAQLTAKAINCRELDVYPSSSYLAYHQNKLSPIQSVNKRVAKQVSLYVRNYHKLSIHSTVSPLPIKC